MCESDLAKELTAVETQEADSQSEYDSITQENKVAKTTKEQDVKYKTQEAKGLDKAIAELSNDKTTQETELAAVNEYYGKIKDRCVAKPETYEERAKRREAEISGLNRDVPARLRGNPQNNNQTIKLKFNQKTINLGKKIH